MKNRSDLVARLTINQLHKSVLTAGGGGAVLFVIGRERVLYFGSEIFIAILHFLYDFISTKIYNFGS